MLSPLPSQCTLTSATFIMHTTLFTTLYYVTSPTFSQIYELPRVRGLVRVGDVYFMLYTSPSDRFSRLRIFYNYLPLLSTSPTLRIFHTHSLLCITVGPPWFPHIPIHSRKPVNPPYYFNNIFPILSSMRNISKWHMELY